MVIPERHDENHAIRHGVAHGLHASVLLERVLILESNLLRIAECSGNRVARIVGDR